MPTSVVTTAAILLGVFLIPEMLVTFGKIGIDSEKLTFTAAVEGKPEVILNHEIAKKAEQAMKSDN